MGSSTLRGSGLIATCTLMVVLACGDRDVVESPDDGLDQEEGGETEGEDTAWPGAGIDVLFVLDSSTSMVEENADVLMSLDALFDVFGPGVSLSLTTVDVSETGAQGELVGFVVDTATAGAAAKFQGYAACGAICWSSGYLEDDPDHVCGDGLGDSVSFQYLDCVCGEGNWGDSCGYGDEEHLEAILLALCRASEVDPGVCADDSSPWQSSWLESNDGPSLGPDLHVIVISDESDVSRRIAKGDDSPEPYLSAIEALAPGLTVHMIGPAPDYTCNSGMANTWGLGRLQAVVEQTGGIYGSLTDDSSGECQMANLEAILHEIALAALD